METNKQGRECSQCGGIVWNTEPALINEDGTRHVGGCPDERLRRAFKKVNERRIREERLQREFERQELRRKIVASARNDELLRRLKAVAR